VRRCILLSADGWPTVRYRVGLRYREISMQVRDRAIGLVPWRCLTERKDRRGPASWIGLRPAMCRRRGAGVDSYFAAGQRDGSRFRWSEARGQSGHDNGRMVKVCYLTVMKRLIVTESSFNSVQSSYTGQCVYTQGARRRADRGNPAVIQWGDFDLARRRSIGRPGSFSPYATR
jgi:hypothetical protein